MMDNLYFDPVGYECRLAFIAHSGEDEIADTARKLLEGIIDQYGKDLFIFVSDEDHEKLDGKLKLDMNEGWDVEKIIKNPELVEKSRSPFTCFSKKMKQFSIEASLGYILGKCMVPENESYKQEAEFIRRMSKRKYSNRLTREAMEKGLRRVYMNMDDGFANVSVPREYAWREEKYQEYYQFIGPYYGIRPHAFFYTLIQTYLELVRRNPELVNNITESEWRAEGDVLVSFCITIPRKMLSGSEQADELASKWKELIRECTCRHKHVWAGIMNDSVFRGHIYFRYGLEKVTESADNRLSLVTWGMYLSPAQKALLKSRLSDAELATLFYETVDMENGGIYCQLSEKIDKCPAMRYIDAKRSLDSITRHSKEMIMPYNDVIDTLRLPLPENCIVRYESWDNAFDLFI